MKRETADYLAKAREALAGAKAVAGIGVHRMAAREAYLAAFHAAEAYILERSGKTSKTHRGVRALFNALAQDDPDIPQEFADFLSDGYDLKWIADYGVGPGTATISAEDSTGAIDKADRMIRVVSELLA